ncbi:MAG: monofunctional biosynthetic peptidoglycan transglycosylase [Amphritea sp.]
MVKFTTKTSLYKTLLMAFVGCLLFPVLMVLLLRVVDPSIWMWQLHRQISPPVSYPDKIKHSWVPIENISQHMQLAVIASEDQKFPEHWGFDIESINKALQGNGKGKRIRGASTLSQQTAKNLFLWPAKSYLRKGVEAGFTVLLEALWDKQRILEVYLNIVEFGPGIYGVEAASKHYFGTSAKRLSSIQAARLAAVLPNPYRFNAGKPSGYIWKRSFWIKKQMRQLGSEHLTPLY